MGFNSGFKGLKVKNRVYL